IESRELIAKAPITSCFYRSRGYPIGDDVVVGIAVGGYYHQFQSTSAPLTVRLDTDARAPYIFRLGIVVSDEIPVALEKAKTERIAILQRRDPQFWRIGQRPPYPFTCSRLHQKAIRIVHFRAKIIDKTCAVFSVEEHAREGSYTEFCDVCAR